MKTTKWKAKKGSKDGRNVCENNKNDDEDNNKDEVENDKNDGKKTSN